MSSYINSLVGCRLHAPQDIKHSSSNHKRILSTHLMTMANQAISFNGRHFIINFNLTTCIPKNILALIEEKVRRTNFFIEDILEAQNEHVIILAPDGQTTALFAQTKAHPQQYSIVVSWHHMRITLNPDLIKQGLRSGWSIPGLSITKQTIKVACYQSRTNLRAIHHRISFDYDSLHKEVCCQSKIER